MEARAPDVLRKTFRRPPFFLLCRILRVLRLIRQPRKVAQSTDVTGSRDMCVLAGVYRIGHPGRGKAPGTC